MNRSSNLIIRIGRSGLYSPLCLISSLCPYMSVGGLFISIERGGTLGKAFGWLLGRGGATGPMRACSLA